jgi:uncharacterized RDD family membrane protein YckC
MPPEPPGPPTPPPGPPGGPPPPPAGGPGGGYPGAAAGVPRPGEIQNRLIARVIDHVILGVVWVVLYIILLGVFLGGFSDSVFEWLLFGIFLGLASAALYVGYFAVLESSRGQTVGKMVMKLKTFGPDGVSNPTMEQAAKRNAYPALLLITVIPFVGYFLAQLAMVGAMIYIAMTLNQDQPKHQGWHDKFAGGTQVMQIG